MGMMQVPDNKVWQRNDQIRAATKSSARKSCRSNLPANWPAAVHVRSTRGQSSRGSNGKRPPRKSKDKSARTAPTATSLAVVWREIFWAPAVERSPTVPNPMAFGGFLFVSEGRSSRSRIHQRSTNDHEAPRILDGSWALGLLIAFQKGVLE